MKALGGVLMFLGGMAMLLGLMFVLLSLKNLNDLNIWFGIGIVAGGFGLLLTLVGYLSSRAGDAQTSGSPDAS